MKIERIPLDAVIVGDQRRKINYDAVAGIAASLELIGQLQPITVYKDGGKTHLVAGRHRLEAAKSIGWVDIDAVFVTGEAIDHRLREISENLHRAELTVLEQAEQIAEWAELTEQKSQMLSAQAAPKAPHRPEGGDRKIARDPGIPRDQMSRAKKIAGITDEAKAAAKEAGFDDNQSKLLKVASAAPEQQMAAVADIAAGGGQDKKNKQEAATDVASFLYDHLRFDRKRAREEQTRLVANLRTAGAHYIADALLRMFTAEDDVQASNEAAPSGGVA
jgi:ParB family chromosome partitioning protein